MESNMKSKSLWILTGLTLVVSSACILFTSDNSPKSEPTATPYALNSIRDKIIPQENFSADHANTVPPDEILNEIGYFGRGGGGPSWYCMEEGKLVSYSEPTILLDPVDTELMLESVFVTCGWSRFGGLIGTITYPDGRIETHKLRSNLLGTGILSFTPTLSDPEGIYQFEISDKRTSLESNAYFRFPSVPRLYELNDTQLLFYNFLPGESVRLFSYAPNDPENPSRWDFVSWQEYMMGQNGSLLVNAPVENYYFVAVDSSGLELNAISVNPNKSGISFVHSDFTNVIEKIKEHDEKSESYRACKNNTMTHLVLYYDSFSGIRVKSIKSPLLLYSQPRYTARVIQEISLGKLMYIHSGPYCYDNSLWWEVGEANEKDVNKRLFGGYL